MGREFITHINGSHTVFAIATKPGHAEVLANEVAMTLMTFSPVIRGSLCFKNDFRLEQIGELGMVEGIGGQYVVPVIFTYSTEHVWSIDKELPPIRHISMRVLLNP